MLLFYIVLSKKMQEKKSKNVFLIFNIIFKVLTLLVIFVIMTAVIYFS